MFYQLATDGTQVEVPLRNRYAGPFPTPCWIIAGGPSLSQLPVAEIAASLVPKFAMNLAGHGLIRPNFWTSYDPTPRFQRSIYLDASITKFVHRGRAMDLVPETTYKVCEAPATFIIDRNRDTGYHNFLNTSSSNSTTDWQDSFIQTIDIAYQLGFRELILAGTDMFIPPSEELQQCASEVGIRYQTGDLLKDFVKQLETKGVTRKAIETLATGQQYHFDEQKDFGSAINTDFHYFRVGQYLRLARQAMSLAGLSITSVTPHSRLNDYFRYEPIEQVFARLATSIGDPAKESTAGLYTEKNNRKPTHLGPMRDFRPHFWPEKTNPCQNQPAPNPSAAPNRQNPQMRLQDAIRNLPEIAVPINEVG